MAAELTDDIRVPLDSLHADALYLASRVAQGTMSAVRLSQVIRERIDAAKAALTTAARAAEPAEQWRDMSTAPKDATMLRLLVQFDEGSFEDSDEPVATIGTNHFANTGVDEWLFAGWNWTHDCFTQGTGQPLGWLPLLAVGMSPSEGKS